MTDTAGIGHNNPPSVEEEIHQKLLQDYDDILALYESTLKKESEMPPAVTNDDESGRVGDYIKKLNQVDKMLEASRKGEKEKYDTKSKAVHAFFKKKMEVLDEVVKRVSEPNSRYLQAKADAKRRAEEERAAAAAAEAARKLAEAQEAQRKAEEARRKAEEEAAAARRRAEEEAAAARRKAEEERQAAERDAAEIRRKAEADAAAARADAERIRAESAARDEESRREAQRAEREAKEREAAANARIKQAEKEAREREEEAARQAREQERVASAAERDAEEQAKQLNRDAKEATRDSNRLLDEAARADKFAQKTERAANASLADFARTRGDHSVGTLATSWDGKVIDRNILDLEALRQLIPLDALDKAVSAYARNGGRELRGATIWEDTKTRIA